MAHFDGDTGATRTFTGGKWKDVKIFLCKAGCFTYGTKASSFENINSSNALRGSVSVSDGLGSGSADTTVRSEICARWKFKSYFRFY